MSNSQGMHSPVEQFEIKPLVDLSLGGYDVSFTNSSLFMLLAIGVSALFLVTAMRRGEMVPGRMQGMAEMMYEFVAEMVRSNVGSEGRPTFHSSSLCLCSCCSAICWPDPIFLYIHLADCCHLCHGCFCVCWRNTDRTV